MSSYKIIIIGGGLAGVEAAYQVAKRGIEVELYEMRPEVMTGAHSTGFLGELVCSNSLGSTQVSSAAGLLKEELKLLDSFFIAWAEKNSVPAGSSLAVDRIHLAEEITSALSSYPNIKVIRREIKEIPVVDCPIIIATGPLTASDLARSITDLTMRKNLFFFDATSPIINADSINLDKIFKASRYDKGEADFLNISLDENQYNEFVKDLLEAEKVDIGEVDKNSFFDGCLPIEEIARRGFLSLAYGPLKPVGLDDPRSSKKPYAVIQLRQDDLKKNFFQLIGFQTRLKWGEQKRIFQKLPGLEHAEFERFGRMHRNTYINAPIVLDPSYQCRLKENVYFAGQITGVEGYVESVSSGLLAGIFAAKKLLAEPIDYLPGNTACGSLVHYITHADWQHFRPTKFTFGLLPEPIDTKTGRKANKKMKKEIKAEIALESLSAWINKTKI